MHTPETCQLLNCGPADPARPFHSVAPSGLNWFSEDWGGHVTETGSGVPSQRHEDDGGPS